MQHVVDVFCSEPQKQQGTCLKQRLWGQPSWVPPSWGSQAWFQICLQTENLLHCQRSPLLKSLQQDPMISKTAKTYMLQDSSEYVSGQLKYIFYPVLH